MANLSKEFLRLLFRIYWIRNLIVSSYNALKKNPKQKSSNTESLPIDPTKIVAEVEAIGFSSVFALKSGLVEALIADCQKEKCVPEENVNLAYKIDVQKPVNPDSKFIKYIFKDAIHWASVKNIISNSTVLQIAKDYLGNEPVIQNVSIWWSFPKPETMRSNIYSFHYDIDNLKFIKLFTYLTPVDENNGPHIIYPNTHKYKTLLQKRFRSVPEDKVEVVFGKQKPVMMTGNKGTSFFEDTFSYHKGLNPISPRLIFQVEYSLTVNKLG